MSDATVPAVPEKKPLLSNAQYDTLKWLALVGLPALATLYFTLAELWQLPKAHEVVGTIIAVDTFLGLALGVAKKQYTNSDAPYDGALEISETDSSKIHQLDISTPPEQLGEQKSVTFKVVKVE